VRRLIRRGNPSSIIFGLEAGFAKDLGLAADLCFLDPMKFLVSRMADLKLNLLATVVHRHGVDFPPKQRNEPDEMAVCKAVEDRLCHPVDLTSRADLTDQQIGQALRLLLKIVRRNDLVIEFSPAEISLLARGPRQNFSEKKDARCQLGRGLF
jgi:hypothetical protein